MNIVYPPPKTEPDQSRDDQPQERWVERLWREAPSWLVSIVVHIAILLALACIYISRDMAANLIQLVTGTNEPAPEDPVLKFDQFQLELPVETITLAPNDTDPISQVLEQSIDVPDEMLDTEIQSPLTSIDDQALVAALASDTTKVLRDGTSKEALRGSIIDTGSDAGSVDRLTIEILRQLQESDVVLVWIMDASGSLRVRRDDIIRRFDRVYDELDKLGGERSRALLTGVVAFGQKVVPMVSPTQERQQILDAVRNIQPDESGVENVFTAVEATVREYAKMRRGGKKLMLVVLTDEIGDDLARLEETVTLVKRHKVPVYVLGPLAPFGYHQINIKWTDSATGEVFYLPVQRGPETAQIEYARLLRWYRPAQFDVMSSGFGPYGLTRLARESGGIYFLYDDGTIPGPTFDINHLLPYAPDYGPVAEYVREVSQSPLREAVLKTTQVLNRSLKDFPSMYLAAGIQFEIRTVKRNLAATAALLDRSLQELERVEKFRFKEADRRWRAHYDLLVGRLLADRIRCDNFLPMLEDMYVHPKVPKDVTKNAWQLAGIPQTALSRLELDKADERTKRAYDYLQRVVREHARTPWAALAQQELDTPLAFRWEEAFMEPPKGEKLPWEKVPWTALTEEQKQAVAKYNQQKKKREEAKKRRGEAKRRLPKL